MKKIPLFLFFLFCSPLFCFAQEETEESFEKTKINYIFSQKIDYNFMAGGRDESLGFTSLFTLTGGPFNVMTGIGANSFRTDVACQGYFIPRFKDYFSAGITAKYHFYQNDLGFVEHNLLGGFIASFNHKDRWSFWNQLDAVFKASIINAMEPKKICIREVNYFFSTGFDYRIKDYINVYAYMTGHTFLDDTLSFAPQFVTGVKKPLTENQIAGIEFNVKWQDLAAFPESFNQFGISIEWGIRL